MKKLACLVFACWILAFASPLSATPLHPAKGEGENKKAPRWPKDSTINVYIDVDTVKPQGVDRSELIKEGVERWKAKMATRGVTITVTVGPAPKDAKNVVKASWAKDGTKVAGLELGTTNNAIATSTPKGCDIVAGEIVFSTDQFADMNAGIHQDNLKNVAEHEMCHVLGFADDDNGSVTKHKQPFLDRPFNAQDTKELNDIYGTANSGGEEAPKGDATKTGGGAQQGGVSYGFRFMAGNDVPDPDDPEHVSFISIGIPPEYVLGAIVPPGWIVSAPHGPMSADDPFFTTDDYMIDGSPMPAVWTGAPPRFVALRVSAAQSDADGVPAGVDPALSLDTPQFQVQLQLAPGLQDCEIEIWAGGAVQTVPGPFIVGPASHIRFDERPRLSWPPQPGADVYDVVIGELNQLRQTGGRFDQSLFNCIAVTPDTFADDPFPPPPPGIGLYFLVRARGCGPGSWDSREPSQLAPRDPQLNQHPQSCP